MNKFKSIKVGDKAELTHTITPTDIEKFVDLTGDDNKLHVDKDYASKTTFKKPVVHGMLGASFISTVIGTKLPGDGALWCAQNLAFLLPVRVGDKIIVKAEVIKKIERTETIELSTDIYNQHKQKVTSGTAKVKLFERDRLTSKEIKDSAQKKIALVAGGTGGIGREACLQLAKDGFDVAIHYYANSELAHELKENVEKMGCKSVVVAADIRVNAQVEAMIEHVSRKLGAITVLVNCAVTSIPNIKFHDLEWQSMYDQYEMNIKGSFNLLKSLVPRMKEIGYGKVVFLNTLATEKANAEWLHYITAKSALNGFVKASAVELSPMGVRINQVSPGMTDTELVADVPEKAKLLIAAQAPLRRIATPEDVAGVISFLASEKSDYLTGETIRVNGGQVMI